MSFLGHWIHPVPCSHPILSNNSNSWDSTFTYPSFRCLQKWPSCPMRSQYHGMSLSWAVRIHSTIFNAPAYHLVPLCRTMWFYNFFIALTGRSLDHIGPNSEVRWLPIMPVSMIMIGSLPLIMVHEVVSYHIGQWRNQIIEAPIMLVMTWEARQRSNRRHSAVRAIPWLCTDWT